MSRRLLWWSLTAAGGAAAVFLAFWTPAPGEVGICLFRRGLSLPCPGCGLTRAFAALARGDLSVAVALHPAAPLLAVELLAGWALLGLAAHGRSPELSRRLLERLAAATGFALIALWMGRLAIGDLSAVQ